MPLDLADLYAGQAEVEVPYAGGAVVVRYRPEALTVELTEAVTAATGSGDEARTMRVLVDVLGALIAGWDVTEEGIPMPVSAEALRRFPMRLLLALGRAIVEDVADPNRPTATGEGATRSPSGSPAAGPSARSVRLVGTA